MYLWNVLTDIYICATSQNIDPGEELLTWYEKTHSTKGHKRRGRKPAGESAFTSPDGLMSDVTRR